MEKFFSYNKRLKTFARRHRNDSTKAEIRIWCELLRNKQMMSFSFLRQRPIGPYIADFFSKELNLVIEVDGYTHTLDEVQIKDKTKTAYLQELGFSVLRFTDEEVMHDIENVRRTIELWIESHPPTPFKEAQEVQRS
jgi:very-short-patch-repair endonuclease